MPASQITSLAVLFGRLFWMIAGPLLLMLTAYFIVISGTGWRTFADLAFFLILGGMILGRWVEFRSGNPQTSTGEPATPADFQYYVWALLIGGPVVWLIANLLGNHWLASGTP